MQSLAIKGGDPVRTQPFHRWPDFGPEEAHSLLQVLSSGKWGFDAPQEAEFCRRFASFCGTRHALAVSNGSVSLELALRALGVGPGDEVVVPALTWIATASAVIQAGATPVFADVREADWCLDPVSFREKITPRTRAVIPVHLYSQMAEMDEILEIARAHSISVIEDCAHAHGFQWGGRAAGTLGAVGSFSFQQSKPMTAGEGGVLITDDSDLAARIYSLKNCGRKWQPEGSYGFGSNYRMTDFQAAVLLGQLSRFEGQLATKAANVQKLRQALDGIPGLSILSAKSRITRQGMYGLALRFDPDAFAGMPVEVLVQAAVAEGIPVQRTYDVVYRSPLWLAGLHDRRFGSPGVAHRQLGLDSECPVAEKISREGLVILHHVFLGPESDMADLAAGLQKVQAHAGELRLDIWGKRMRTAGRTLLNKLSV